MPAFLACLLIILFTFRSDSSPVAVPFWVTLQGKRVVVESARLERVDATDARIKAVLKGCAYRPVRIVCLR